MSETLGPYELQKRIGAGGMADVFLARGPRGVCVVKRPHAHLCANPEFVRMFLDEAAILAQLHHPNIAQIFDLGTEGGSYYLAMEYVPGFDLMTISLEHERQGELMAAELCARIVADIAGALHFAHEAKDRAGNPLHIIHRDVSPHNVLLSTQGVVKLIDFGVARTAGGTHRTQAGLVKGKYPYMSPEQITGAEIDRRVDVYALGLVLYELLTNVRAISGNTEIEQIDSARIGRIRPIEQLRANLTMPLRQILGGCLHPDPGGRYPTALAVKEDLEKYLSYERHVVGQEDLLRLFRVVAAETGHTTDPASDLPSRLTEQEQPAPPIILTGPEDISLGLSPTVPSQKVTLPPKVANALGAIAMTQQIAKPPSNTKWLVAAVVLVLFAGAFSLTQLRRTGAVEPEPVARVELDVDAGLAPVVVAALEVFDAGADEVAPQSEDAGGLDEAAAVAVAPKKAAVLTLEVEPVSDIAVDGVVFGRAPQELELVAGKHQIVLTNKALGFSKKFSVDLKPGARERMSLKFAKGHLEIQVDPFGDVVVDGVTVSGSPSMKELDVWEGQHTVVATLSEGTVKKRKTVKVDVQPNATERVVINLMAE